MKTISYTLILTILIFCACSSTYRLKDDDFSINELNRELRGESATILLQDSKEYDGENISVTDSLTYWKGSQPDCTYSISTSKVKKLLINVTDKEH
jgi:hypothetical protein